MSCYLRHLEGMLREQGIELTSANRRRIDRAIHDLAGVPYKDCPAAWRKVKSALAVDKDRADFITKLRKALESPPKVE